jgi:hypothetical protein
MRAAALLLALVGLNACSDAIVRASFNSSTLPPAAAPLSASHASVRVVSTGGSGAVFASMLFFGTLLALEDSRTGLASSGATSTYLYDGFWARSVPELDPERRISEQDCSRPLDLSLGNIRCK